MSDRVIEVLNERFAIVSGPEQLLMRALRGLLAFLKTIHAARGPWSKAPETLYEGANQVVLELMELGRGGKRERNRHEVEF